MFAIMMRLFLACSILSWTVRSSEEVYYVCGEVGDMSSHYAKYVGAYTMDKEKQLTYTNKNGKSIFRHGPFWYMGDVSLWPPLTDYRCVVDCPSNTKIPPVSATFTVSDTGIEPAPMISNSPCKSPTSEF